MEQTSVKISIQDETGSVIIAVIIAMVVMSVLAAGLITMSGTSLYNQVGSNSSSNAFHLAEAGYRYARSNINSLADIHDQTFTLEGGNSFHIKIKSYDFDITGTAGTEIQTQVPYGEVPFESNAGANGDVSVGSHLFQFTGIQVTGNNVSFRTSGGTLPSTGKVKLAARKNGTSTVSENSDIYMKDTTSLNLFPEFNGSFKVGADRYLYRLKSGTMLTGITSGDGNWPGNFTLNDDDPVILENFIELQSTGQYGSFLFGTKRRLTYHIPISGGSGSPVEHHEDFTSDDNWQKNNEGSFTLNSEDALPGSLQFPVPFSISSEK